MTSNCAPPKNPKRKVVVVVQLYLEHWTTIKTKIQSTITPSLNLYPSLPIKLRQEQRSTSENANNPKALLFIPEAGKGI